MLRQTIYQVRGAAAAVPNVHVLRAVDRRLHGRQRRLLRPGEAVAEYRRQPTKEVTKEEGIPDGWEGMDCGPKSMELFREKILASATVIWNGPAGVFEFDTFSKGTKAVLDAVAETTAAGNKGIIGGGDSATAAAKFNMEDKVTFVSTGGGASLELLEGKVLPGIAALDDA